MTAATAGMSSRQMREIERERVVAWESNSSLNENRVQKLIHLYFSYLLDSGASVTGFHHCRGGPVVGPSSISQSARQYSVAVSDPLVGVIHCRDWCKILNSAAI